MQQSRSTSGRRRLAGACFPVVALVLTAATLTACSQASAAPPAKPPWVLAFPGNASVGAHWDAPAKGATVTSYTVTARPGGHTCTAAPAARSCTVTGLVNGTTYTLALQAMGAGGASAATTSVPVAAGVPWPPSNVTGVAGDSTVALHWTAPLYSPGGPVLSYRALSYPAGGSCTSTGTSCTATGLTNGKSYAFVVVAVDKFGASPPSTGSAAVTPSTTAGGSAGITYLGPVSASQESNGGTILQRDAGISVALPNGRDLWIFGDTSSFSADASQSSSFIGGSTAAKGRYVPGQTPSALKDIRPAGSSATAAATAPSQFIPVPTDTYMPDGSGRPCTPANGAQYTARWPTGATLLDPKDLFVTYTDVCVVSPTAFTQEGWGFMIYRWSGGKIKTGPYDVFPPTPQGAALPASRLYQSPVIANGMLSLFTSECTTLFIVCSGGSVEATTLSANLLTLANPASYGSQPAVTDGSAQWAPVNVTVAAYPSGLRLIEQTSIGGTFVVFSSATPTGPWHAFYSGTLPGCSTTPKGFCYAFVGHPELGSNTSLIVSFFKPDSPENADVGHVDLASVPLPA